MAKEWAKPFYRSKAWKAIRKEYIENRHGICEHCGGIGVIVHHKIVLNQSNINDRHVSLNKEHLELLCLECHNTEHARIDRGDENERVFTADGDFIPPLV